MNEIHRAGEENPRHVRRRAAARRSADMREQMFRLRFQWAMGQTETLNKMRELRKDRARLQTILREKAKGK